MNSYDVFNGDADGLFALLQLRLTKSQNSTLITGVKRDINLLNRVDATSGDQVTVLDISLDSNIEALHVLLDRRVHVFYCDHHRCDLTPESPYLTPVLNTHANVCTSLLINQYLEGKFALWAVAGAFGDNLHDSATALAKTLEICETDLTRLKQLGQMINYNAYGRCVDDLLFNPEALYAWALPFSSPLAFIQAHPHVLDTLEDTYHHDMNQAAAADSLHDTSAVKVIRFPDAPWANRIMGEYANALANQYPNKAHALVTPTSEGLFTISVRAPKSNKQGASAVCKQFATGGGREAAAGINALPADQLDTFIDVLQQYYQ